MNVLWVACNTTSLDAQYANFTEIALCKQVDGEFSTPWVTKLRPILVEEDYWIEDSDPEIFLAKINQLSADPRKQHTYFRFENPGRPLFHYSPEVLRFLNLEPSSLLLDPERFSPLDWSDLLSAYLGQEKWTLAGWGVQFFELVLGSFLERLHGRSDKFPDRFFPNPLDLIPAYRLAQAFLPELPRGASLPQVASALRLTVDLSAESKLQAIVEIARMIHSGGIRDFPRRQVSS